MESKEPAEPSESPTKRLFSMIVSALKRMKYKLHAGQHVYSGEGKLARKGTSKVYGGIVHIAVEYWLQS